jgi:cytochrome c peroxidase
MGSTSKHMRASLASFVFTLLTFGVSTLCATSAALAQLDDDALRQAARSLFDMLAPVPPEMLEDPAAALGRRLFWDERLSSSGSTACASCHAREAWGADTRRFPVDARGRATARHSQTVFNATEQPSLRWVGDRRDAAHQAERSISGSMGFPAAEDIVAALIESGYGEAFAQVFEDDDEPISPRNYGRALEAYQRTLITPSPFDAYLAGDTSALTHAQKQGLSLFVTTGCAGCHNGALLGGTTLQRFGILRDYWLETGSREIDTGLHGATGNEADLYVFRTPMLRNVAKTAPYFHDGSVESLAEAVRIMGSLQLGRELPDNDIARIVAFLESLTGELPAHYAP